MVYEVDSRIAEADRILAQFERANVPTNIAAEMLPALLSPSESVRAEAGRWLTQHASVGLGVADTEQDARELRQIQLAARQHVQSVKASNPAAVPSVPGLEARFHASDEALNARADEAMRSPGTPGDSAGNAARLAAAEADVDAAEAADQWLWGR
ncbi:hypothetical protein GCM10028801_36030 [Nocardioides maradonensis]